MATPSGYGNFSQTYVPAMGQLLPLNQYQALYAIVGTTWGGDGRTTVGLPNLGGRVVVGSGRSPVSGNTYVTGQYSGVEAVALTAMQLPQHNHTLSAVKVDTSKMTATTSLSGLTTTTNLAGVAFTSSSSSLTLNGSSGGTLGKNPSGATLGTQTGPTLNIYSDAAPTVAMKSGSVTGTVSGTLSGTAPGTVSGGTATTTLGGAASLSGATDPSGLGQQVSLMQPYLVMNYYVAANGGIFPTRD